MLLLAVMIAWSYTVWVTSLLDTQRSAVRAMLLAVMFASILMSTAITSAFTDRAWLFVTGYLAIQVGRTAFVLTGHLEPAMRAHFGRTLVWTLGAAALWVAGTFLEETPRLVLWASAVVIELGAAMAGHPLPGKGHTSTAD